MPFFPGRFTSTNDGQVPLSGGGTANFLRADGTWNTPSGGAGGSGMNPQYIANQFYMSAPGINANAATSVFATTITRWTPIWIGQAITISQLGARVSALQVGGNFQIAIYAASASTNLPTGSALGSTPSCSTTTQATVFGTFASAVSIVTPGLYWLGIQMDNTTSTFTAQTLTFTGAVWQAGLSNSANFFFNSTISGTTWTTTGGTYGTWPSNPTVTEGTSNVAFFPLLVFKVSSVP